MATKSNSKIINYSLSKVLVSTIFVAAAPLVAVFVDGLFTSNLMGVEQFNAVNLVLPISNFVTVLTLICNMGGSLLSAKALAVGDKESQNRYFTVSLYSAIAVAWIAIAVLYFNADQISSRLCPTETGAAYVKEYLVALLPYFIFLPFATTFNNMIQIEGNPSLTTKVVLVANIVNILLDYVFIALFGWGLKGAAWATVVSGVINAAAYLPYFLSERCRFKIARIKLNGFGLFKTMFAHGIGFNIFYIMTNLLLLASNSIIVNTIGTNGLLLYGVCTQIQSITLCVAVGMCIGGISMITYLQGAENQKALFEVFRKIAVLNGVFYFVLFVLMSFFPQIAISAFNIEDPAMISQARIPFFCYFLYYLCFAITAVHTTLSFQLQGHISAKAVIVLGLGVVVALLMYIFSFIDAQLIWFAFPIGGVIAVVATLLYGYGFHKKNPNLALFSLFEKYSNDVRISRDIAFNGNGIAETMKALDQFGGICELSEQNRFFINVCFNEFCDLMQESGPSSLLARVYNVTFCYKGDEFVLRIKAPGSPMCSRFDPEKISRLKHEKYNMSASDIRTLLINNLPDGLDYAYVFGLNITTMHWKLNHHSSVNPSAVQHNGNE